jgi:hypothetical protein
MGFSPASQRSGDSAWSAAVTERHFGLGARTNVDVEVEFNPSGRIVRHAAADADTVVEVREDGDPIFASGFE